MHRDIRFKATQVVVAGVRGNSAEQVNRMREVREGLAVEASERLGEAMPKVVEATVMPTYSAKTITAIYNNIDDGITKSRTKFEEGMKEVSGAKGV